MESRKNSTDEPICRVGIETQIEKRCLTQWGQERVGQTERVALTYIYYHM